MDRYGMGSSAAEPAAGVFYCTRRGITRNSVLPAALYAQPFAPHMDNPWTIKHTPLSN